MIGPMTMSPEDEQESTMDARALPNLAEFLGRNGHTEAAESVLRFAEEFRRSGFVPVTMEGGYELAIRAAEEAIDNAAQAAAARNALPAHLARRVAGLPYRKREQDELVGNIIGRDHRGALVWLQDWEEGRDLFTTWGLGPTP